MRSRNIKPDFFIDEDLSELPFETRLLFIGLWCAADREGRVEDRPKRLKAQVFPFDDVDIDKMLTQLQKSGHIARYSVDGVKVVRVNNFTKHQAPHHTEKQSVLPCFNGEAPESNGEDPEIHASSTVNIPLIPDSGLMIEDSRFPIPDPGIRRRASKPALSPAFADFWAAYPKRAGKGAAEAAWVKVNPDAELAAIINAAVEEQKSWRQWREGFVPNPATWLNQRRWEDELPLDVRPLNKAEQLHEDNARALRGALENMRARGMEIGEDK